MQASLTDEEKQTSGGARVPAWLSAAQPAIPQQGAGLLNATGEYNCFLNVIVQCLWRCTSFRHAVMQWPKDVYQVSKQQLLLMEMPFCGANVCIGCFCPCSTQARQHRTLQHTHC